MNAIAADRVTARVEEAARAQLAQQADRAGLLDPQFDVTVVMSGQPPACAVPVNVTGIDARQPSRMRFEAVCPGADGWRREFIVRAQVSARVLVAASDIPAGQILSASDMTLERRTISTTPDVMSDKREAAGMSARRTIRAGDSVRKGLLVSPVLVKRGDTVRIVASKDGVEVTVAGVAMEGGASGAIVRVRNASSGNVIRTRIIGDATVEPLDIPVSMPSHSPDLAD
ncbi:flagellar basal body P-ring formation protein FlgA [Herbaspirillum sp. HC18]|nr:flagellar basal body P-ring formation protein FlgA [Herbaspirillum sp. HC18]